MVVSGKVRVVDSGLGPFGEERSAVFSWKDWHLFLVSVGQG